MKTVELWVSDAQYEKWERMASAMCLNIYEYVRRCADAHTTILENDYFEIVPKRNVNNNDFIKV